MAFGAARRRALAYEAGRDHREESRALGVHVNFAPVVDVNNNPRNPVINTRSFGEDPARVAALASAYVRGLQTAGVIATLKHFPGHGDTDVDSHLGLPMITHPRERLERSSCRRSRPGSRAGVGRGDDGAHRDAGARPAPNTPTTLSQPIVTGVLRQRAGVPTAWSTPTRWAWRASRRCTSPGEAAVRAVLAGNDVVLHSPDDGAAFAGMRGGGRSRARSRRAQHRRVGRAHPARQGVPSACTRVVLVDLDAVSDYRRRRARTRQSRDASARSRSRWSRTRATRCR